MSSDASMSPALINPPNAPSPHLAYPGDDDDDAATRIESPPVTTPADHPDLGTATKAPDAAPDTLSPHPDAIPLADTDAVMADADPAVPVASPAMVSPGASSPPPPVMDEDPAPTFTASAPPSSKREFPAESEPAVKRARSEASGSGAIGNTSVPMPLAAYTTFQDPPPPPYTGPTIMSSTQHKFCFSTVRTLKRLKDATPFLRPVDPVALNIPHYPIVVKRPMDFNTIETKLQNSSPNKPSVDTLAHRYRTTDDFVADVRQIFQNCYLFNGPDHFISQQARKLEDVLDKQLKQMPPDEPVKPAPRYESPPPPKKPSLPPARRQSTSVPTIRRNTPDDHPSPSVVRPKREIHPPPPKDLPYADPPVNGKRVRKGKNRGPERDDGTAEQLRYCMKILLDFNKKSLYQTAGPFYEPVDVAYVPNYYKIVKRPMDLATMRRKLDNGEYPTAVAFNNDFRLMMKNCQTFNPPGTAVHSAGLEMDRIFREKWKNLPPLRQLTPEEEDDADSSEDEHAGEDTDLAIAMMESQIENMKDSLALLKAKKKNAKVKAPPPPPPKEKKPPPPPPKKPVKKTSSAYAPPYPPAPGPSRTKTTTHKPTGGKNGTTTKKARNGAGSDTERSISTMSFEQKKELSTTIESLDGDKLEKVIQIIYEGMPDLQNSNEEIELDIESLSPAVLTKLWNFVVKPQQQKKSTVTASGPKRTSGNASKGAAATGGVKRKSMDEAVESERIRKLQAQIDRFGKPLGADGGMGADGFDDDVPSSNGSGSESDSGSDSD